MKPIEVTDADLAFGGNMKKLMPNYKDIPEEFKYGNNKWCKITARWFFKGLSEETDFIPKDEIDGKTALRHLMAILKSFEPKHEHKEAAVSFLLSQWFDDVKDWDK